jgi:hypothetical protein
MLSINGNVVLQVVAGSTAPGCSTAPDCADIAFICADMKLI